ncbi:hypothetical protein [Hespellia stercorisuis]|uniref:Uncharacterized protein n=1 Tax=Hespellia stercorisuis DSM 15480 TaxID=1121950 RepID=A0A1M6RNJ2_9FIRM|nr:hypothetical protein [Hespellia stercorisuis]SHK33898.1 hypothetical protein SAMN02745243_02741 [Hespellia stercorisuis DSM 15480]
MRIKVVTKFNDRITGERMESGKCYEYSDTRAKELIKTGYATAVSTKNEEKKG